MSRTPQPPRSNNRHPLPVRVHPLMTVFLWAVGLVLFFRFYDAFKLILLGFIAAACVASMLHPIARWFPGSRALSAAVVGLSFLVAVLGVLGLMSWLLVAPVSAQLKNWPQIEGNLNRVLEDWSQRLGVVQPPRVEDLANQLSNLVGGQGLGQAFARTADWAAVLLVVAMFVFIGSIYLLAEPAGRLTAPLFRLLPAWRVPAAKTFIQDLEPRLRWWLIGTFIGMAVVGVASFIGYTLVGMQWALPLAIFAGVSEAVPTIGPAVTFMLALLLGATQGVTQVVGAGVVYAVVQTLESYVLIPLVIRSAVNLPPVVTLFTIVLWGKIFGIAGLLLAVPIDLIIWGLLDHFVIRPDEPYRPP